MTVYTRVDVDSTTYIPDKVFVDKSIGEYDVSSNFGIEFNNNAGDYGSTFNLNDEVEIWADKDSTPATTKIFTGIIENIKYAGRGLNERMIISGRDYTSILQDIIVDPRIYKKREVSEIVSSLLIQNINGLGITWNNINTTTTDVDQITFNNISVFDAIKQLAEIAGYLFYIDTDKDFHFEERDSISSGLTFDNTNVTDADFSTTDSDIFNSVTVYGDRQLTGAKEEFSALSTGSTYTLDSKPSNVRVIGSGTIPTTIQPGGIINVNDPADTNLKWLVDYQSKNVILTSGTTGGDNLGWTGSNIIFEYDRSSPIISIREDSSSITNYGQKDRKIIDRNVTSLQEANLKANTFLSEHKDPVTEGTIKANGVVAITPGETCVVDIPFQNIVTETYTVLRASYNFSQRNNSTNNVLSLTVNKRKKNFINYMKEVELRLRNLEGAEVDTSIINLVTNTGSVIVSTSYKAIQTSIGSVFMFHTPNHDILNSPTATFGQFIGGSIVKTG